MIRLLAALLLLSAAGQAHTSVQTTIPTTCFRNGHWFTGTTFQRRPLVCIAGDHFLAESPAHPTRIVDLQNHFVVPPYGDAHEHNFDNPDRTPQVVQQYLADGIFYAQGMTDVTTGARQVVAAGLVNTPTTVDVTYAHGGLTAINGHPKEVYESIANGFYYPATPEQKQLVINSRLQAGNSYWEIDSPAGLAAKWPQILAAKPDLIKIYLNGSEHYTPDSHVHPQLGDGLDPALVPLITARAHAAGLKVAAHIDTATDFHVAVTGGVDEIGHLPGYYIRAKDDTAKCRLADADIATAAAHHVRLQATAGIYVDVDADNLTPADLLARKTSQIDNLSRLKAAGVPILIGSDHYGQDAVHEADYLQSLGLWTNLEMLQMWSVTTPKTIFPHRNLATLTPGAEASFLVLMENPLEHWPAVHHIESRWKQGQQLAQPAPPPTK